MMDQRALAHRRIDLLVERQNKMIRIVDDMMDAVTDLAQHPNGWSKVTRRIDELRKKLKTLTEEDNVWLMQPDIPEGDAQHAVDDNHLR